MADRVLDVRLDEAADEGMARPGRVGSHEDVVADKARIVARLVAHLIVARQAGDHLVQQLEVILGIVGAGVAGTKHRRERFVRRVAPGADRGKAIPLLVGRPSVLLLRVNV